VDESGSWLLNVKFTQIDGEGDEKTLLTGQVQKIAPNASNSEILLSMSITMLKKHRKTDNELLESEQLFKVVQLTRGDFVNFKMKPVKKKIFGTITLSFLDKRQIFKRGK